MSDWYAKLSGRFWRHPKRASLSDAGLATWTVALSYCADNRTDGVVTHGALRLLRPHDADVRSDELLTAGLWEPHPSGFKFHDFDQHGLTVAKWEARKKANREYQKKSRAGPPDVRSDKALTQQPVSTPSPADPSREDSGLRTHILKTAKTGYAKRYEKTHAFPHGGLEGGLAARFADWAIGKPEPEDYANAALDGYFADQFWRASKHPVDGFKDYDRFAAGRVKLKTAATAGHTGPRKRAELLDGAEAVAADDALRGEVVAGRAIGE